MGASAGYNSAVRFALGAVAHTAEAFSNSDSGVYRQYKITAAARRILSLADGLTVKVNGTPTFDYTVDTLFGTVTFGSALIISDVVTADTNYFPLITIGVAKEFTLKVMANPVERTAFEDAGDRKWIPTLRQASVDLGLVVPAAQEFTTDISFDSGTFSRGLLVTEIQPDVTRHEVFRMWSRIPSTESKALVAAIAEGSMSLISTGDIANLGSRSFGWGVNN